MSTATVTPEREREIVGLRGELAEAERDLAAATENRDERLADVKRRGGMSAVDDVDVHRLDQADEAVKAAHAKVDRLRGRFEQSIALPPGPSLPDVAEASRRLVLLPRSRSLPTSASEASGCWRGGRTSWPLLPDGPLGA